MFIPFKHPGLVDLGTASHNRKPKEKVKQALLSLFHHVGGLGVFPRSLSPILTGGL